MATDDIVLAYLQKAKEKINFAELYVDLSGILFIYSVLKEECLIDVLSSSPSAISFGVSSLFRNARSLTCPGIHPSIHPPTLYPFGGSVV